MTEEYGSDAHRMQVKETYENLLLPNFMAKNDITDVFIGMKKLVEHINGLAPQCPRDFRSDAQKTGYFSKAITGFTEWSHITIQSINAH